MDITKYILAIGKFIKTPIIQDHIENIINLLGDNLSKEKIVKIAEKLKKQNPNIKYRPEIINKFLDCWEDIPTIYKVQVATVLYFMEKKDNIVYSTILACILLQCQLKNETFHNKLINKTKFND